MPLGRRPQPFDHPDWLFELKYDGFRAIAIIEYGRCTLYSRNGHEFKSCSDLALRIGNVMMPRSLVLDGEIVCLDANGFPQFNDLLVRRGQPSFVAFDLLDLNGKDLRPDSLVDRKRELRRILNQGIPLVIYADHIEGCGIALFEKACGLDLEGIVAKLKNSPYNPEQLSWLKIRNRDYSQWVGRNELFERERHQEPVPGWHACTLAAAAGD